MDVRDGVGGGESEMPHGAGGAGGVEVPFPEMGSIRGGAGWGEDSSCAE